MKNFSLFVYEVSVWRVIQATPRAYRCRPVSLHVRSRKVSGDAQGTSVACPDPVADWAARSR